MGEQNKKRYYIGTTVSMKEKQEIEDRASKNRMKISEYIRYSLTLTKDQSEEAEIDQIYSLVETAKILKTSRTTVYSLIDKGILPFVKIGKQKKIKKKDLEEYINNSKSQKNTDIAEKLWSSKEIAKYLGCTQQTAQKYLREGKIPAIRIGRKWMAHPEEIRKIRESNLNDHTCQETLHERQKYI